MHTHTQKKKAAVRELWVEETKGGNLEEAKGVECFHSTLSACCAVLEARANYQFRKGKKYHTCAAEGKNLIGKKMRFTGHGARERNNFAMK